MGKIYASLLLCEITLVLYALLTADIYVSLFQSGGLGSLSDIDDLATTFAKVRVICSLFIYFLFLSFEVVIIYIMLFYYGTKTTLNFHTLYAIVSILSLEYCYVFVFQSPHKKLVLSFPI